MTSATTVPCLPATRSASTMLRLLWADIRAEVERRGGLILRVAGRERVHESDLLGLLGDAVQPTAHELTDRVELAINLTTESSGCAASIANRRRGERDNEHAPQGPSVRSGAGRV